MAFYTIKPRYTSLAVICYVFTFLVLTSGQLSNSTGNTQECHMVLNSTLETLYSPDFPNASPVSRICSWQINAEPGKYVAVLTTEMDVGGSDWDCTKGYLEIYDGCGADSFLVEKVCSSRYQSNQRYLWVSTGSCVFIKFNSAGGTTNKFLLKTQQTSTSCNAVFQGTMNGTFSTPVSSPVEQEECTWILAVPRNKVELKFKGDFHIQGNSAECKENTLRVQNGRFSSSHVLNTFCGHTRPYPVYSTVQYMRITLKSSARNIGSGNIFTAQYTMVDKESFLHTNHCDSEVLMTSPHGSFVSPGYPDQYPEFLKCIWMIQVKSDRNILLRFKDFDVEGDDEKCQDYVEIYNGLASWSTIKGRYCGRDIPPVFRSDSNKLRVVFTTNKRYAGRGFEAVFSDSDPNKGEASNTRSHFTGIMIGTTCGIIFIVLSVLAVFHARKRRIRRALERSDMASTISFDVHQANAPPSYETVMASPNLFPTPKGDPADHSRAYEGVPSLHHEVCHLLGSNPDSDDEEPPPAYHGLFGDDGDVHAYRLIGGDFTVEYHPHSPQGDQAEGSNNSQTKKEGEEAKPGRVWQRRDFDQSRSSVHFPRPENLEQPKENSTRPPLERQDTCSSFVTDV